MPYNDIQLKTKTAHTTTIAASVMLATSSLAMFLTWGMMAFVISNPGQNTINSKTPQIKIRCEDSVVTVDKIVARDIISKKFKIPSLIKELDVKAIEISQKMEGLIKDSQNQENKLTLKNIFQQRKELLLLILEDDPVKAGKYILEPHEIRTFKKQFDNCIESNVELNGQFLSIVEDSFAEEEHGVTKYYLLNKDNGRTRIYFLDTVEHPPKSGKNLTLNGFLIDSKHFLVKDFTSVSGSGLRVAIQDGAGDSETKSSQKLLVLMFNFNNTNNVLLDSDRLNNMLKDVNDHFEKNSYNQTKFTGVLNPLSSADVVRDFTIDMGNTCLIDSALYEAMEKIQNLFPGKYNFTHYDRFLLIAKFCPSWGGYSSIGKFYFDSPGGRTYASVSAVNLGQTWGEMSTATHELGHGFGNEHDKRLICPEDSEDSQDCFVHEYGGISVMAGSSRYYIAHQKENMNWFRESEVLMPDQAGQYVLTPMSYKYLSTKALKIQPYLYAEFRQPYDWDGVISERIDTLFQKAYLYRGSVQIGRLGINTLNNLTGNENPIFIDPFSKSQLTYLFAKPRVFIFDYKPGKTDFILPTVTLHIPNFDTTLSGVITMSAEAFDTSGIEKVSFHKIGGYGIHEVRHLIAEDFQAPYEVSINTVSKLSNGYNRVVAVATDMSGIEFGLPGNEGRSNDIELNIRNTGDVSAPQITDISYPMGENITNPVSLSLQANDNIGIFQVNLLLSTACGADPRCNPMCNPAIDPLCNRSCTAETKTGFSFFEPPYSVILDLPMGGSSTCDYTFVAEAKDFTGNITRSDTKYFKLSAMPQAKIVYPKNGVISKEWKELPIQIQTRDGSVSYVEYYQDNDIQPFDVAEEFPFDGTWQVAQLKEGGYKIFAKAHFRSGTIIQTDPIQIIIDYTLPKNVIMIEPKNYATLSGLVKLSARAFDEHGIKRVGFTRVDDSGSLIEIGWDYSEPFEVLWETSMVSDRTYNIYAMAEDMAGNQGASKRITLSTFNKLLNSDSPTVRLRQTRLDDIFYLDADARDDDRVDVVLFYRKGEIASFNYDREFPFQVAVKLNQIDNTIQEYYAVAFDNLGNRGESNSVKVDERNNDSIFRRGDANFDGIMNISDPITILGFLFSGNPQEVVCSDAADADDSGDIKITDAIFLLQYLFNPSADSKEIPAPGVLEPGPDPTADPLGC